MFATIACPACKHKFTIPEGAMGNRHVCPNCQSPFIAGKSVSEADAPIPMKYQPAPVAAINKTMLGETEPPAPPIRYNCPRCKKPMEKLDMNVEVPMTLDRCREHGIWFDSKELKLAQVLAESGSWVREFFLAKLKE